MAQDTVKRTRFVCVSDTHNSSPEDGAFKLPDGDILVHAGDWSKQGTYAELKKTLDWIDKANFEVKLVVAGNHDITLDPEFYVEHGPSFHNQCPQDQDACVKLVEKYRSIKFLNHESALVRLESENGPKTSFKVFGSPYSPRHGLWAFGYTPEQAPALWNQIPLDTDVLITHTPPKYHCDESGSRAAIGCEILRQTMWRVRPSLHICGHVHEGRGGQIVQWDLSCPNVKYKELATTYWADPGFDNKKQSLFDLSRKAQQPLQNTGPFEGFAEGSQLNMLKSVPEIVPNTEAMSDKLESAVRGQGGEPPSGRCDMQALDGRMGRKETCVVNAAILASNWPYKVKTGRKYNKPIVVDLDLPVCKSE